MKRILRKILPAILAVMACMDVGGVPQITNPPTAPVVVNEGQVLSLIVGAQGQGTLQYQWFKNEAILSDAVFPNLDFFPLKLSDSGRYHVVVTDETGFTKSSPVILRVAPASSLKIVTQPRDMTVQEGANTSLSVSVITSGTPQYQWYQNDIPIGNSNSPILSLSSIRLKQSGTYYVEVTDSVSTVTSEKAEVTVLPGAIQIVDQIADQLLHAGQSVTLWVDIVMQEPVALQYQWYKDGSPVTFANKSTLTINAFSVANEGQYVLKIKAPDAQLESDPIKLELNRQGIFITRNPGSYEVLIGGSVTFEVEAISERALTYQWFKGTDPIQGATSRTYTIAEVKTLDSGVYSVQVSNSLNFVKSLNGRLTTYEGALKVEQQPQPKIGLVGQTVAFSAKIIGSETIAYQWFKNGEPMPNRLSPNLILENIQVSDSATYKLQGKAKDFEVFTSEVDLIVKPLEVVILNEPANQNVTAGDSITLTVVATSPRSIQYKWFFQGVEIPNSNTPTLIIPKATAQNSGEYYVELKSLEAQTTSQKANIRVESPNQDPIPLKIMLNGNKIDLSWDRTDSGVSLEASPMLGPSADWTPLDVTPISVGESIQASIPAPATTQFFRIRLIN